MISLAPSYGYTVTDSRWNVPQPATAVNPTYFSYQLDSNNYTREYVAQTRSWNPTLVMDFAQIPGLQQPRISYTVKNDRSYVENTINNTGSLEFSTGFKAGDLFGHPDLVPAFNLSHRVDVNSRFNNNIADDSDTVNRPSTFGRLWGQEAGTSAEQNFWQSIWWVRMENLNFWDPKSNEDLGSKYNVENLAVAASRKDDSKISTTFNVPISDWKIQLSPRGGFNTSRDMLSRYNHNTSKVISLGTGFEVPKPSLPWSWLMKPENIRLQYDYSLTQRLDNSDSLFSNSESHAYSISNPNRPWDEFTVTFEFAGSHSTETQYNQYQAGGMANVNNWRDKYNPALRTTYILNMTKPWKLPDFWPFYGRELKFTQAFRLNNDFLAEYINNHSDMASDVTKLNTTQYTLNNSASYNVLTNLQINFMMSNIWFTNVDQGLLNYYSITLKLGVVATF
jgi:hypothetical protein